MGVLSKVRVLSWHGFTLARSSASCPVLSDFIQHSQIFLGLSVPLELQILSQKCNVWEDYLIPQNALEMFFLLSLPNFCLSFGYLPSMSVLL